MEYTYAAPLQPGDTIAVVAPSSTLAGADVTKGLVFLRSLGYELKIGKSVSAFDGYLAGPDRLRAADGTLQSAARIAIILHHETTRAAGAGPPQSGRLILWN